MRAWMPRTRAVPHAAACSPYSACRRSAVALSPRRACSSAASARQDSSRVVHLHAVAASPELEQVVERLARATLGEPQARPRPEDVVHVADVGDRRARSGVLQHDLGLDERATIDECECEHRADVGHRERRQAGNRESLPAVGLRVRDPSSHVARALPTTDRGAERQGRSPGPAVGDQQIEQLGELIDSIGDQQRVQRLVDRHAVRALLMHDPATAAGAQSQLGDPRRVAAEEGAARGDAAQHLALGLRPPRGRHERVDSRARGFHGAGMRQAKAAQLGLQRQPQLVVFVSEISKRLLEHRCGTGNAAVQHRHPRQQQPGLGSRGRRIRAGDRFTDEFHQPRRALAGKKSSGAELDEGRATVVVARWLGQRPVQIAHGDVGSAAVQRGARRASQGVDDLAAPRGRRPEQVRSHELGRRVAGEQQRSGSRMPARTLRRPQLAINSPANDRVHEAQRQFRTEDLTRRECVERDRGRFLRKSRKPPGNAQIDSLSEDRHGDGKITCPGGHPPDPQQNRA